MSACRRPVPPAAVPPLRLGDFVQVTYRTSSGPAHWTGSVLEVFEHLGMAHVSDGHRHHVAAVKGAAYVRVLIPAAERIDVVDGVPLLALARATTSFQVALAS